MGCTGSKSDGSKYAVGNQSDSKFDDERVTGVRPSKTNSRQPSGRNSPKANSAPSNGQINNYVPKKPKLDVKDFQFIGLRDTVKVKAPGSINGQAFTIDDCQGCDLYLLDNCAQVNIDGCKDCRLFVGPTAGSIFLRDSTNVKLACVTRQLRLRDTTHSQISLLCRTQPIIESSSDIELGCFSLNYTALPGQLKAAKLEVVHNFWWWPYDFTPKPDNWRYLAAEVGTEALLGPLPEEVTTALGGPTTEGALVVTWGERPPPADQVYMFTMFPPNKLDAALQFLNQAKHQATILHTNSAVVEEALWDNMKAKAGWPRAAERTLVVPGPCVGVELCSDAAANKVLASCCHVFGGQHTESQEVGALFRKLGLEGSG